MKSVVKGIRYTVKHPIFVFRRTHHCPQCGDELVVENAHSKADAASDEAKWFFRTNDWQNVTGEVEVRTPYFYCTHCGKTFAVEEIRDIERKRKVKK